MYIYVYVVQAMREQWKKQRNAKNEPREVNFELVLGNQKPPPKQVKAVSRAKSPVVKPVASVARVPSGKKVKSKAKVSKPKASKSKKKDPNEHYAPEFELVLGSTLKRSPAINSPKAEHFAPEFSILVGPKPKRPLSGGVTGSSPGGPGAAASSKRSPPVPAPAPVPIKPSSSKDESTSDNVNTARPSTPPVVQRPKQNPMSPATAARHKRVADSRAQ